MDLYHWNLILICTRFNIASRICNSSAYVETLKMVISSQILVKKTLAESVFDKRNCEIYPAGTFRTFSFLLGNKKRI